MRRIYDKRGIPICVGDVLKVDHYTAGRRKFYMYKWVLDVRQGNNGEWWYVISHLKAGDSNHSYKLIANDSPALNMEIVQGYAETENGGYDYRRRDGRLKTKGGAS